MKQLASIFYYAISSRRRGDPETAAFILGSMSGDNTIKGYAKKLRMIADELDKIPADEIPY